MFYTEEQIKRANERSISEYFRREGYSCKRSRSETHIEGFGGFFVNENTVPNKYYIHSKQEGGAGLISCLMKVMDMPFKDAVRAALDGELGRGEEGKSENKPQYRTAAVYEAEQKAEFISPEMADNNKRAYSYLTKTRCIDPDIVNDFIRSGHLFQDTKGNAVFLHIMDGKPCGAELHGTTGKSYTVGNVGYSELSEKMVIAAEPYIAELLNRELKDSGVRFAGYVYEQNANIVTDKAGYDCICEKISEIQSRNVDRKAVDEEVNAKLKNYKGVAPGTSESFFQYDKGNPQKAYVFESSIDLMSFMSMHPDVTDCKFAAMAGLKPNVVEKLLASGLAVTLCVDNDNAGAEFCRQFAGRCKRTVECAKMGVKDYNELLVKGRGTAFEKRAIHMLSWANKSIAKAELLSQRKVRNEVAR
ncbi:MAG: DUF3991 domain-containing protein [Oscillospiraceae bacterium]